MSSLTRRLARLTRERAARPSDYVHAERFVRDWLGSFTAGAAAPTGRILQSYADGEGGLDAKVFLAGALSHVTETDDLHPASITHPGCVVVPAALLLGRRLGVSGHAFLHAVLTGYEAMTRVGEALGPAHYRTFHNTATAGVFGSAAAAATLLRLDEDGWVWAFGNAGTQASGLWEFNNEGAMSKPLHAGHAAAAGLRAALLAQQGFTGAERVLEGEKGLFRGMCPDARPDAVLADAPGWKLPETSMKPYPCCRHTHPAIDSALEVRERTGGASPARVRITTYPAALEVTNRPAPRSRNEAHFSIQYCVATALVRGRPSLDAFDPEAVADPRVRAVLERTTVDTSAELAASYPHRWGAGVEVEGADGKRVGVMRRSAKGDPDAPLDDAELDAKVLGLFAWAGLDAARGRSLLRRCRRLAEDGPLFALPRLAEVGGSLSAYTAADLLRLLDLERIEHNIYRGQNRDIGSGRIFGGQVLSQALVAARRTVEGDRQAHSVHGYFILAGDLSLPVVYFVDRLRDGKSFCTRRVTGIQHGHAIFEMASSFHRTEAGHEHQIDPPNVLPPEGLRSELDILRERAADIPETLRPVLTQDRPLDIRPLDRSDPFDPVPSAPRRRYWIRAVGDVGDEPVHHQALLAYASDYGLLGSALQPHGLIVRSEEVMVASLDHALWFHRPFRVDEWLLYDIESPVAYGARAFTRGAFYTRDGVLVASVAQEGLVRPVG